MTDNDLTAPEAVERLVREIDATLRALSAALGAETARTAEMRKTAMQGLSTIIELEARAEAAEAERDALKAELAEAVGLIHILRKNARNDRYADAFLARHQKGTEK